jgi:hypothetical protein
MPTNKAEPPSARSETSAPSRKARADSSRARAMLKWLAIFQEHFQRKIKPELTELYLLRTTDIDAARIEAAWLACLDSAKFFPRISEIGEAVGCSAMNLNQLNAGRDRKSYLERIRDFYCAVPFIAADDPALFLATAEAFFCGEYLRGHLHGILQNRC